MNLRVSRHLDLTFDRLIRALGWDFGPDQLITYVSEQRRKELIIQRQVLPFSMTGGVLELADADLIFLPPDLDAILGPLTLYHECGHLLLGYLPWISDNPPTYAEFLADHKVLWRQLEKQLIVGRGNYDSDEELAVEQLARMIYRCTTKRKTTIPEIARRLYGYEA
jgi:hypothetical protein